MDYRIAERILFQINLKQVFSVFTLYENIVHTEIM